MKAIYIIVLLFIEALFFSERTEAQAPPILWQKTIGGFGNDIMSGVEPLGEAILLSGYSNSGASGDKKDTSYGGYDYWLVKMLATTGKIVWERSYGGSLDDTACKILKTTDNAFILAGNSLSSKSGAKTVKDWGASTDYWVLKLDKNGQILWQQDLGGTFTEKVTGIGENSHGYAISGHSYSDVSGDKITDNSGGENHSDLWMAFLETSGKLKKTATYAPFGQDLSCCILSSDGGNIIGSTSYSRATSGIKTKNPIGNCDYWIVRTDLSGTRVYDSTFGGTLSDHMTCLCPSTNGTIMIGGYSNSPISGTKTDSCRGVTDYWIIKMKQDGTIVWQKTLGGSGGDYMTSIKETHDGGYIAGGYSSSNISGEKTENSKGGNDYWIVKLDSLGNKEWDKTFGGSGDDKLVSVDELALNEYILAGYSNSPISGDKDSSTVGGTGKYDYWVIRLGKGLVDTVPTPDTIVKKGKYALAIVPNPAHDMLSIQFSSTDNEMTPFGLFSYDGRKVLSFSFDATVDPQTKSVSIAKLPAGVYYLTMYTKQKPITQMVLKL